MSRHSIHISIPTPCHERWDAMSATEQGAFCQSCHKEVIDFSAMTDRELIEYLEKHKTGCGRFRRDQVDVRLSISKVYNSIFKWKALLLGLLPVVGFTSVKASSGVPIYANVSDNCPSDTTSALTQSDSIQINGKVINEQGEGMINALVFVENAGNKTKTGAETDLEGKFILKLTRDQVENASFTLKIKSIGYQEKSISITNQAIQYYSINYQDKDEYVLGGMQPVIVYKNTTAAQKIKNWFRRTFRIRHKY